MSKGDLLAGAMASGSSGKDESFVAWHEVACPQAVTGYAADNRRPCLGVGMPWTEDGPVLRYARAQGRLDLLAAFGGQSCEGGYEDFVEWRGLYWEGAECGAPRLETLAAGVVEKVVASWLKYEQAEEDRFEKEKPLMRRTLFERVVFGREVQGLLARALPGAAPTSVESGLVVFDEWHRGYAKAGGCEYDEECWPKDECVVAWAKSVAEFRFPAEAPVKCRTEALPVSEADRAEYLKKFKSAILKNAQNAGVNWTWLDEEAPKPEPVSCIHENRERVYRGHFVGAQNLVMERCGSCGKVLKQGPAAVAEPEGASVAKSGRFEYAYYRGSAVLGGRVPTPEAASLLAAKKEVRTRWCAKRGRTVKLECRRCPWCKVESGGGASSCLVTGTRKELAECLRDVKGRRASR